MTTVPHAPQSPTASDAGPRVTWLGVLAAERLKLASLRSTWWLLAAGVLSILLAGISPSLTHVLAPEQSGDAGIDLAGGAVSGIGFTQLIIGGLGVVVVSSEYASGLVRATFTAVPTRLPVLVMKAVVVAGATFVATLAAVLVSFAVARAVLASVDVAVSVGSPGVLRALLGSAVLLAGTAVVGSAFGWIVRSTAGGLAAVFGYLFVLPVVGLAVPGLSPYLPSNAGAAILQLGPAGSPSPWVGFGLFVAYTAVLVAIAGRLLTRRDA
jgi:ABC-type transport system involved in multi-copper enzyme maturation permease subunit